MQFKDKPVYWDILCPGYVQTNPKTYQCVLEYPVCIPLSKQKVPPRALRL